MNAARAKRQHGPSLPAPTALAPLVRTLVPEVARSKNPLAEQAGSEMGHEAAQEPTRGRQAESESLGHSFGRVALFAAGAPSPPAPPQTPEMSAENPENGIPVVQRQARGTVLREGEGGGGGDATAPPPSPPILPPVPDVALTPPPLLRPDNPSRRYGSANDPHLRLDPKIIAAAQQFVWAQLDPTRITGALGYVTVGGLAQNVPGASAAGPAKGGAAPGSLAPAAAPSPPSAVAAPSGAPSPAPASPGTEGGETARTGTAGDVLKAALALPEVNAAVTRLQNDARDRVARDWHGLNTGEKIVVITSSVLVGGGVAAAVISDPGARQLALSQLNGQVLPVPYLPWSRLEVNTQGDSLMIGIHVDVGSILPPSWGFGPSSPQAMGGPPEALPPPMQRRMEVSQPGDPAEVEAERVADSIMRFSGVAEGITPPPGPVTLRRDAASGERNGASDDVSSIVASGLAGGGQALDGNTRAEMEGHFGQDLGEVRIHTGAAAADSATDVAARAYTVGGDIAFASGEYAPGTSAGKRLLAHELTHVVQQNGGASRSVVRRTPPKNGAAKGQTEPADAAALVAAQYPRLVLPAAQIAALQKVLDARAKIEDINKEIAPISASILSSDVARRDKLLAERFKVSEGLPVALVVSTDIVLGKDVLPAREHAVKEATFREMLYTQLLTAPTRLKIGEGLKPEPLFQYFWGPNDWAMGHTGGLMQWSNLMGVQKWNLEYQKVLLGEMSELVKDMEKNSRSLGDAVQAEGKKLGEIWGFVWNSTVTVGPEVGRSAGYYDDPQGWAELYGESKGGKGARIYIKGPRGFIHVFGLNSNISSYDLTSPDNNGVAILLNKGSAVTGIHSIRTADGFELAPGSSDRMGGGWTCKEQLTTIEQFAIGAIMGDAFEDPSVMMSFGQIAIGVVPIVGQVADARDIAVGIHKMWSTGGKDGKLQTALAFIGLIPLLGDGIKAARKGVKGGAKEAVNAAVKEAVVRQAPAATESLGRKLLSSTDEVAKAFPNLSREAVEGLKELPEKAAKAMAEGGKVATEFASEMSKRLDDLGGNAGSLVAFSGGKWATLAKTLLSDTSGVGKEIAGKMQAWRKAQFAGLEAKVAGTVSEVGDDVAKGATPPKMQVTGTDSAISDVDISFLGPNATAHRNAAIRAMEGQYGKGWRDLLDADIFGDPRRLHLFDDLPADVAKGVEKRLVKESELNILAKMLKSGTTAGEVEALAKQMGVKMEDVLVRRDELLKLAGNEDLVKAAELKMDSLHQQFLKETDPVRRAAIAEEMSQMQGKLNAAVEGPYVTPGGVAKHVTRREGIGGLKAAGAVKALSPAMGYMAFLDDLYMLQHVLDGVGKKGFGPSSAKSMSKYADRLAVSAGQYGVDMSKAGGARNLFNLVETLLDSARKNPKTLVEKAGSFLEEARGLCQQQVKEMLPAVKKSADDYLLHPPEGMTVTAADRAAAGEAARKSEQTLNSQFGSLAGLTANSVKAWWDAEEKGKSPDAVVSPQRKGPAPEGDPTVEVQRGVSGGGRPLEPAVRRQMEPRFGHDFSRVRVHTDARASASADALNARAYASGSDLVFGAAQYAPETSGGQRLLAHELAHTVQQGVSAPLATAPPTGPGIRSVSGTPVQREPGGSTPAPAAGVMPPSPPPGGAPPAPAAAPASEGGGPLSVGPDGLVHVEIKEWTLEQGGSLSPDILKLLGLPSPWEKKVNLVTLPIPEFGSTFTVDFNASVGATVTGTYGPIVLTNIRLGMTKSTAIGLGLGALASMTVLGPSAFLAAARGSYISGFANLKASANASANFTASCGAEAALRPLNIGSNLRLPNFADVRLDMAASLGASLSGEINAMTGIVFDQGSLNIRNAAALKVGGGVTASLGADLKASAFFGLLRFDFGKHWSSTLGFSASKIVGDMELAHNGFSIKDKDRLFSIKMDTINSIIEFVKDSMLSDNGPGHLDKKSTNSEQDGPDTRNTPEKEKDANAAAEEADTAMSDPELTLPEVRNRLLPIKRRWRLTSLDLIPQENGSHVAEAVINPHSRTKPHFFKEAAVRPANAPAEGTYVISQVPTSGPARESSSGAQLPGIPNVGTRSEAYKIIDYKESNRSGVPRLYARWAVLSLDPTNTVIVEGAIRDGAFIEDFTTGRYRGNCSEADVIEALTEYNFLQRGTHKLKEQYQGSEQIRAWFYGTGYKRHAAALFGIQHDQAKKHPTYDPANAQAASAWLCPGPAATRMAPGPDAHVMYAPYDALPATIDHIQSVADHWNSTGRMTSQAPRQAWDSDINNLQLMDSTHNSFKGSGKINFLNTVDPAWSGPSGLR